MAANTLRAKASYYINLKNINDAKWGHLKTIPRTFEVRSENAKIEFKKYINDIQDLTAGKNMSVLYKVNVELMDAEKRFNKKRKVYKKIRSKKYNVPLKKQSMKLSNFEVLMRKIAEENGQKKPNLEILSFLTTDKPTKPMTTKQIKLKFKPILRKVKTNYTKIIKPVRSKIITLTK
ncbi:uncharacterized protein LOC114355519 [Ostrinia furnacalis]|uniref:uncharacterized protein LOC114355519 n=1 Tax=Ostrinia furnacalis TaxID=93504 RepID=UPI00103CECCE|nr:uncharacterized protein LOC114355519 [Ostrinia furnacalis]